MIGRRETASAEARDHAREVLRREAGLRFEDGLEPRLEHALQHASESLGLRGPGELAARARGGDRLAIDALVAEVLVGETWFFRDLPRLEVVRDLVIPRALAERGRVRIWSCACSGGEEPWSLAALALSVPGTDASRVEILATDLDESALARARRGEYRPWSIRHAPGELVTSALEPLGDRMRVRDHLRGVVRFEPMNLVELARGERDDLLATPWDAILCRNVLMYLEREVTDACLRKLAGALSIGGALVLGAAEPPLPPELVAWARNDLGGNVLVRPDPSEAATEAVRAPRRAIETSRSDARHAPRATSRRAVVGPAKIAPSAPAAPGRSLAPAGDSVRDAMSLADRGKIDEALLLLDADPRTASDAAALSARALLLEGAGRSAEAADAAERALVLDGDRVDASIVAARARLALGDPEAAIRHVERARRRVARLGAEEAPAGLLETSRATLVVLLDHLERRATRGIARAR